MLIELTKSFQFQASFEYIEKALKKIKIYLIPKFKSKKGTTFLNMVFVDYTKKNSKLF